MKKSRKSILIYLLVFFAVIYFIAYEQANAQLPPPPPYHDCALTWASPPPGSQQAWGGDPNNHNDWGSFTNNTTGQQSAVNAEPLSVSTINWYIANQPPPNIWLYFDFVPPSSVAGVPWNCEPPSASKLYRVYYEITPPIWTLNVNKAGNGFGTVTSNPSGINCGVDCDENYANGTSVVLTATPSGGSVFAGWIGCTSTTGSPPNQTCNVTMNENKNVTATFSLPDLTASAPLPDTATVGTAQTFTASIMNNGTASTGAGFSNFFQVATAGGGGGTITDLVSSPMLALPGGWTNTATSSYTFTSAGTYSVRVCADKTSSAGGGVIDESDENNNCGNWRNVTVLAAATVDITANNLSGSVNIPWGGSADLRWSYSDATSCTIDLPAVIGGYPSGSGGPTPTGALYATRLYTISCNPGGANSTVTVIIPPQPKNLLVVKAGQGTVIGTSNPVQTNVNCGPTCQAEYESGTLIVLTEIPNTGRIFTGWSSTPSGLTCNEGNQRSPTCTFTLINDLTITASFTAIPSYIEF